MNYHSNFPGPTYVEPQKYSSEDSLLVFVLIDGAANNHDYYLLFLSGYALYLKLLNLESVQLRFLYLNLRSTNKNIFVVVAIIVVVVG